MRKQLAGLISGLILLCGCQNKASAPESIANMQANFQVTTGTGSMKQYEGKLITANLAETNYVALEADGSLINQGPYTYRKTGTDRGELTLQATAGQWTGSTWTNEMKFETATQGHISGRQTMGAVGSLEGEFYLHQ